MTKLKLKSKQLDWTREDCIEDLRSVAALDPTIPLSCSYYSVHGQCPEYHWRRYFARFSQFRIAARVRGLRLGKEKWGLVETFSMIDDEDLKARIEFWKSDNANSMDEEDRTEILFLLERELLLRKIRLLELPDLMAT